MADVNWSFVLSFYFTEIDEVS